MFSKNVLIINKINMSTAHFAYKYTNMIYNIFMYQFIIDHTKCKFYLFIVLLFL